MNAKLENFLIPIVNYGIQNKKILKFGAKLLGSMLILIILFIFVIGIYPVRGNSMYPMVKDGDLAITLKCAGYKQGQVVTFRTNSGERLWGRIVADEGDVVQISKDGYRINNVSPYEEVFTDTRPGENDITEIVPAGSVYILNDNREDLMDSRNFGSVDKKSLEGFIFFTLRWRNH